MKKLSLIAVLLVALGSCGPKDSTPEPLLTGDPLSVESKRTNTPSASPAGFRLLESRYTTNGTSVSTFVYNAAGRLLEFNNGPNGLESKVTYHWPNDSTLRAELYSTNLFSSSIPSNQPLKLSSYLEIVHTPANQAKWRRSYLAQDKATEYRSYSLYEYNTNQQIVKISIYAPTNVLGSYTTYAYDAAGNVQTEKYYATTNGQLDLISTTVYEHDQKPNPYHTTGRNEIVYDRNTNNITRQVVTRTFEVSGIPRVSEHRWRFEYRPDGYPKRMIYDDGSYEEFIYNR